MAQRMTHDMKEPQLGEIRDAKEIGWRRKYTGTKVIYCACPDCGDASWRQYNVTKMIPYNTRCRTCGANVRHGLREKGANWKGGRKMSHHGYIWVMMAQNNFFYSMADIKGNVFEHRLIMAQSLGRCLQNWEIVHHKNGIKTDNRIENLELSHRGAHAALHNKGYRDGFLKGYNDGKDGKIKELIAKINILEKLLENDND